MEGVEHSLPKLPMEAINIMPSPDFGIAFKTDEDLISLSEELYDHLPLCLRNALDRDVVSAILDRYISFSSKAFLSHVHEVLDPLGWGVVTQENFIAGFPFVLRLCQHHLEDEEAKEELMEELRKVRVSALGKEASTLVPGKATASTNYRRPSMDGFSRSSSSKRASGPELRRLSSTNSSSRRTSVKGGADSGVALRGRRASEADYMQLPVFEEQSVIQMAKLRSFGGRSTSVDGVAVKSQTPTIRSLSPGQVRGLKTILREADLNNDGVVSWEELRSKAPSLPVEPELYGMKLDPDVGVDMGLLLQILYPSISESQAAEMCKVYEEDLKKTFVMPEDKQLEIEELFCFMSGGSKADKMPPLKFYKGLRKVLSYDYLQCARPYLQVVSEWKACETGGLTLHQFTDWYVQDLLSEGFKRQNLQ